MMMQVGQVGHRKRPESRRFGKENCDKMARCKNVRSGAVDCRVRSYEGLGLELDRWFKDVMAASPLGEPLVLNDLKDLLHALSAAEESCKEVVDPFSPADLAAGKSKKLRFACPSFNPLNMPTISADESATPCFAVIRSLEKALQHCTRIESLLWKSDYNTRTTTMSILKRLQTVLSPSQELSLTYFTYPSVVVRDLVGHLMDREKETSQTSYISKFLREAIETYIRYIFRKWFNKRCYRHYPQQYDDSDVDVFGEEEGGMYGLESGGKGEQDLAEPMQDEPSMCQLDFAGYDMGTYKFNYDDIAALVRDALVLYHDCFPKAKQFVDNMESVPICNMVENFTHAHTFLLSCFNGNPVTELLERHDHYLHHLSICGQIAKTIGMDSVLPYLVMEEPSKFARSLRKLIPMVDMIETEIKKGREDISKRGRKRRRITYDEESVGSEADDEEESSHRSNKNKNLIRFPALICMAEEDAICVKCKEAVLDFNEGGEIQCDLCEKWFHLPCLGLPQDFPSVSAAYCCTDCEKLEDSEDDEATNSASSNTLHDDDDEEIEEDDHIIDKDGDDSHRIKRTTSDSPTTLL